ncbi:MAG: OmpA family protein [Chitinophagales bacterium]|nr:OmpA family protein [Hyphomicrobiales bacterium]
MLFETNSDKLEPKARQDLRRIAEYLNNGAVDTTRMHIVGFADSRGAWLHNYNLALARATQVANALSSLIDGAINKSNIHSFSWHAPCACNDGEAGWEKNRRVEIWFDLDEKEKQVPCSETAY